MKKLLIPTTIGALSILLLSGCTYSVHPILLESDQTTDIDLSGTWALKSEPSERSDWCKFSVQSVDGGANYAGATDDGKRLTGRIGKLGDDRFLQLSIHEQHAETPGLLSSVPVYVIARFDVVDDELHIFPFVPDRAIPWFDEHKVPYRLVDDVRHCVLTDDTAALQTLLKDHGDKLFSATGFTFTRKPVAINHNSESREPALHGGKSLDQWIAQARDARDLEDRHDAMQVVRNFGLRTNRAKTLGIFTELLSDDAATIRSLAAAGLRKAGRPTDPRALEKIAELLSEDLTELRAPQRNEDVGDEFVLPVREVNVLGALGNSTHVPALERIVNNRKIDPLLRQMARNAIQEIEARKASSDEEPVRAIGELKFLVGVWKSVEPDNAPPSPETRTITMQPDGQSLTVTSESVLGKGQPIHITYDPESQEYVLTQTASDGERRVFRAKLMDGNRLEIPVPTGLLAGTTFTVTVDNDTWTDAFEWPQGIDSIPYHRRFIRQKTED